MKHSPLAAALLIAAMAPAAAQMSRPAATTALAKPTEADARVVQIATGQGQPVNQHLTLGLNKAAIVELDADAKDVLVSSPDIADAIVKSPRRIFLLGTKTGQTNAFFFDGHGHQVLSLDIRVEKDVADLAAMIKANLPNSAIKVAALNDNVVLSGRVASASEATRAADLSASFTGDPKKVVNMLSISDGEQVMLRVHVSEMQRQIAKQFGINLSGVKMINGTPLALSTSNPFGLLGNAISDLSGGQVGQVCSSTSGVINPLAALQGGGICNIQNNVQGTLKALETVGLLHTLAEPNLTAVSGETAKFLAGGEFPVPAGRDQQGNVSISFKQFGVGLSFTPVVLSGGRISLQISTEVSELTNTGAFTLTGLGGVGSAVTIPALNVRRAETTVELPSGGSFAIAGLMQHTTKQQIDAFPGIKDLPVLGALFRSRDFQNAETELVVMVTPYLVNPVAEAALAKPSDGYITPTDPETLLLGRLNTVYKKNAKPLTPEAAAPVGFVVR
ncbi:MAG: type II and III secretion system protein family protein [Proteobacteria bacterium]|nr:type II and III secretion system protein family protein [Pseudomonadota bacterium]